MAQTKAHTNWVEPIWERQPRESAPAWEAFKVYMDIPSSRSCAKVARHLGKSKALIDRWCSAYKWVRRIEEWQKHLDAAGNQAAIDAVKEMRSRQVNLASGFLAVAGEELKKLLQQVKNNSALTLSPEQIVKIADFATKLERVNRGEPESIQKQQVEMSSDEKRETLRKFIGDSDVIKAVDKILDQEIDKKSVLH